MLLSRRCFLVSALNEPAVRARAASEQRSDLNHPQQMQSRADSPATTAPFALGKLFLTCSILPWDKLLHKRLLHSSCSFCPHGSVCHNSPLCGSLRTRGETHRDKTPGGRLFTAKKRGISLPAAIVAFSWRSKRFPTSLGGSGSAPAHKQVHKLALLCLQSPGRTTLFLLCCFF